MRAFSRQNERITVQKPFEELHGGGEKAAVKNAEKVVEKNVVKGRE